MQLSYDIKFGKQADVAPLFLAWQELVKDPDLDHRFGTEFVLEPLGAVITGTFYGTRDEFDATGIADRLPEGGRLNFTIGDWLGSLAHDAENEALYLGDIPSPFYSKSLAFRPKDAIPEQAVKDIFKWIDDTDKGTLLWFVVFDATGGVVTQIAENATSYPHRDKFMFYQSYAIGIPLSQETKDFLSDFHNKILAVIPEDASSAYAGYVDPALTNGQQEYWGSNLPVLEQIKLNWDPDDVFHNPQSVRPASA